MWPLRTASLTESAAFSFFTYREKSSSLKMTFGIKDEGSRVSFETGAIREPATGKGRYDLLSPIADHRTALRLEAGAAKYLPRNWESGMPFSRCLDAAFRHLNQYKLGLRDEDHLAAARFNLDALMHLEATHPELDDLPDYTAQIARAKG